MKVAESHIVPHNLPEMILDRYVLEVFGSRYTRKYLRKAIRRGELVVDGSKRDPLYRVREGNIVEILENNSAPQKVFRLNLKVLYEDNSLAVIEKPAGIPVNGNRFKTIENGLTWNLQRSDSSNALQIPRPVHRLDAATGGVLLVAKTPGALSSLAQQFQNREIMKTYYAVVSGYLEGNGVIRIDVGGRHAETEYNALESTMSIRNGHVTLVKLIPVTGREHQLRIHMSETGTPIMGDTIYGIKGNTLKGKGLFLWAAEIMFRHPETGKEFAVETGIPLKFKRLMEREQKRWDKYKS